MVYQFGSFLINLLPEIVDIILSYLTLSDQHALVCVLLYQNDRFFDFQGLALKSRYSNLFDTIEKSIRKNYPREEVEKMLEIRLRDVVGNALASVGSSLTHSELSEAISVALNSQSIIDAMSTAWVYCSVCGDHAGYDEYCACTEKINDIEC